ncbi:hypothetical protein F5051DRAFT_404975 [Lentinula edodes]|nr:hypothetical protein F5051DRAFT_404975 [Lentinula edodes]
MCYMERMCECILDLLRPGLHLLLLLRNLHSTLNYGAVLCIGIGFLSTLWLWLRLTTIGTGTGTGIVIRILHLLVFLLCFVSNLTPDCLQTTADLFQAWVARPVQRCHEFPLVILAKSVHDARRLPRSGKRDLWQRG